MSKVVVVKQTKRIGLLSMLTVLFVGLKLTGHIAWSWWWVLAPTWIPFALFLGFLGLFGLFALAVAIWG